MTGRPGDADPSGAPDLVATDRSAAERLLRSPDPRSARLGIELLASMPGPPAPELALLARDSRTEVRLAALVALAAVGDRGAQERLGTEVAAAARSPEAAVRAASAHAADALDDSDRCPVVARLLADPSPGVRTAALEAVHEGDRSLVDAVLAAVDDADTWVASRAALGRLGDVALGAVEQALRAAALDEAGSAASRRAARLVRAVSAGTGAADALLLRWAGHHDRGLGLVVLGRLSRAVATSSEGRAVLDEVLADDLAHAVRVLGHLVALDAARLPRATSAPVGPPVVEGDDPLRAALADELVLVRERVLAGAVARRGGDVLEERLLPLLDTQDAVGRRLARLCAALGSPVPAPDLQAVLTDLVEDSGGAWRSPWVRACALRAACDREMTAGLDLVPAMALGDPMVDEELDRIPW